jgi:hypothetical protein
VKTNTPGAAVVDLTDSHPREEKSRYTATAETR